MWCADAIRTGHGWYASARYRGHKYSCSTFGKGRQLISLAREACEKSKKENVTKEELNPLYIYIRIYMCDNCGPKITSVAHILGP